VGRGRTRGGGGGRGDEPLHGAWAEKDWMSPAPRPGWHAGGRWNRGSRRGWLVRLDRWFSRSPALSAQWLGRWLLLVCLTRVQLG
jgi:hypothetical protein